MTWYSLLELAYIGILRPKTCDCDLASWDKAFRREEAAGERLLDGRTGNEGSTEGCKRLYVCSEHSSPVTVGASDT